MKVTLEYVENLKYLFEKERGIRLEIQIKERKLYYIVDISTCTDFHKTDRIETIVLPRLFLKSFMKPMINRAFGKIKHRYEEWGLMGVKFSWKECVGKAK